MVIFEQLWHAQSLFTQVTGLQFKSEDKLFWTYIDLLCYYQGCYFSGLLFIIKVICNKKTILVIRSLTS